MTQRGLFTFLVLATGGALILLVLWMVNLPEKGGKDKAGADSWPANHARMPERNGNDSLISTSDQSLVGSRIRENMYMHLSKDELARAWESEVCEWWYTKQGYIYWDAWARAVINKKMTRQDLLAVDSFRECLSSSDGAPRTICSPPAGLGDFWSIHFNEKYQVTLIEVNTFQKFWGRPSRSYLESKGIKPEDWKLSESGCTGSVHNEVLRLANMRNRGTP